MRITYLLLLIIAGCGVKDGYQGGKFHTFGIAAICWAIWKTRNKMCFEGKALKDPVFIVCYVCALMSYWVGLYSEDDKDVLTAGVNTMMKIALKLLSKKRKTVEDNGDNQNES